MSGPQNKKPSTFTNASLFTNKLSKKDQEIKDNVDTQKYKNPTTKKKTVVVKKPTIGKPITPAKTSSAPAIQLGNNYSTYNDPEIENDNADLLALEYRNNMFNGIPDVKTKDLEFMNSPSMGDVGLSMGSNNFSTGVIPKKETEPVIIPSVDTRQKEVATSMYDELAKDLKTQKTMGILGYALQGMNAASDFISNENQPYSSRPPMAIPNRIGFTPTDIEPYNRKMDQTSAGYMKYLKETGNAEMLPSIYGMEDKRNEMYGQVTDANNKGQMQVDATNAQIEANTNQLNASMMSDYEKLKLTESQYKDQARRSNKQAFFGSMAGIGSTLAGASSQKLKLSALKDAADRNDWDSYKYMLGQAVGYVPEKDYKKTKTEETK